MKAIGRLSALALCAAMMTGVAPVTASAAIEETEEEITEAEVTTAPNDMLKVAEELENKGYHFSSAEVAYIPSTYTKLSDEEQLKNFGTMIELLDEDDDVQGVWHNLENEEDLP